MNKFVVALLLLGLAVGLTLATWWGVHVCYMLLASAFGWPAITYWQAAAGCALVGFIGGCFRRVTTK